MAYNASIIEKKWQENWDKDNYFEPKKDFSLKKKYILSMFPYPSGRIHMGHVRNYTIGDALARYYRKIGFNVLHPIGFDSFGMPAENAAIKHKIHPKKWTYDNIAYMQKELFSLGFSFSKKRILATSDPLYTKFEQEFFIKMFEKGLIYTKEANVNWCEHDQTVLANEQVEEGKCWRCGNEVIQKKMPGYYIKITSYADELLKDLEKLKDKWPNQVLTMQENWIGKSEGLEFTLFLDEESVKKVNKKDLQVFTTRADTIYGISYIALSVEHDIVKDLIKNSKLDAKIIDQIKIMQNQSPRERQSNEKEGYFLGIYALHPLTKEKIPIWVANFVLSDYGSGAVMAVPAHDERDFEFAKKYNLEFKEVISSKEKLPFTQKVGKLINSDKFNDLDCNEAREEIIKEFKKNNLGKRVINFKIRDWGVSRQRYWGTPIPMVKCNDCGLVCEKIENLPILLPEDVEITGEGNPLDRHLEWINCSCPKCGKKATRESDTLDTFFESSWYYARFASDEDTWQNKVFDEKSVNYWLSVDEYIGGIEHAILHLLYARFFQKVLRDLGYLKNDEPFLKLLTQGMVLKDGFKMSKSKGNVVDPDEIIKKYGADTARLFILFAAPPAKELEWNDDALEGAYRFICKLYDRALNVESGNYILKHEELSKEEKYTRLKVYEALKKSEEVYNKTYAFNTLIAACMEAINALNQCKNKALEQEAFYIILNILEPIIPHVCFELSDKLFKCKNFKKLEIKEEVFRKDSLVLIVSVNGKKRSEIEVLINTSQDEILNIAKKSVQKWIQDKVIVKEIYIKDKLVNLVIK